MLPAYTYTYSGLDWTGLDWTGLDWTGLDWTGLDWMVISGQGNALLFWNRPYFNPCAVHLLLFCTMTNKCVIISQIITLLHVSTLSCHSQGACNQYLAKLHRYLKCS
jgi:hypothetical protein